jgi:hypothetical protein
MRLLRAGHFCHNSSCAFGTKEALIAKFDQLTELRNGIRHSGAINEIVRQEGEAAILWFRQVLSK